MLSSTTTIELDSTNQQQRHKTVPPPQAGHIFGIRPRTIHRIPKQTPLVALDDISFYTFSNILWTILVGWWVSLFFVIAGLLCFLLVFPYRYGIICMQMASFVFYPFGKFVYLENTPRPFMGGTICYYIFSFIFIIPLLLGALISWEFMFYIPMVKSLIGILEQLLRNPHKIKIAKIQKQSSTQGRIPTVICYYSGSTYYFKYQVRHFEVVYLNLWPFVLLGMYIGFLAPESSVLMNPIVATFITIIGTIPCMYIIGVCTEILSARTGLVIGSLINAGTTGLVELILFYFSIKRGLPEVVRAAVTGAFLMNLLVIPGLSMFAAGIKWKEVKLNKKVQSVSGTILLLAIIAVFFPAIFYSLYRHEEIVCDICGDTPGYFVDPVGLNCTDCRLTNVDNLETDEVYEKRAKPLMYVVSICLPIVYVVGLIFSLKTHKYIYDQFEAEQEGEEEEGQSMSTWVCVVILLICTVLYSVISEVLTDHMPAAIEDMHLTERFAGLVFYTLIPAIAEFINSIRFALEGNMGLSLEIGNQGAMVVSLIQMPALVLMSVLMGIADENKKFNLMFQMIDVFSVIISVLLRNSMLQEGSINYFTGFAFLIMFLLISLVYYFDPW